MKNSFRNSLTLLSVLGFIILPVVSPQETASPDLAWCLVVMLPAFLAGGFSHLGKRGYIFATLWLFLSAIISGLGGPYGVLDHRIFKFFVFIIYFLLITSHSFTWKDILYVFNTYIILSFIVSILIILSYVFGYAHVESNYYLGRYSVGITGLYKNPNYLTAFINVAFFLVIYQFLNTNKKMSMIVRLLLLTLAFTYIVAIYLSGTRAALLTAATVLLVSLFLSIFQLKNKSFAGIGFVIFAGILIFYLFDTKSLADNLLGRRNLFEDDSRKISWAYAISIVQENPFIGAGMYSWARLPGAANYLDHLHNIYLEILLNQGLVGFFGFILLYFWGINKVKRKDIKFFIVFCFVMTFPLSFQNGYVEANFWRFMIVTKLINNYSADSKYSIDYLINHHPFAQIIRQKNNCIY